MTLHVVIKRLNNRPSKSIKSGNNEDMLIFSSPLIEISILLSIKLLKAKTLGNAILLIWMKNRIF